MIVIHNPLDVPVKDYPIQDPQSKETALWTINPGETLEFPDHVGKYLLEVYGFLQEVVTEEQVREREEEKAKIREGKVYNQVKVVKAEGEVIDPPSPQAGFTNENLKPEGKEVATPPASVKPVAGEKKFICPDETCRKEFKAENHLRVHYGLKHAVMPS